MATIDTASSLLEQFGLASQSFRAWAGSAKAVSSRDELLSRTCARSMNYNQLITFDDFESNPRSHLDLLEVYGEMLFQNFDQNKITIWEKKYVLPDENIIGQYQAGLEPGRFSSFQSLVESFTDPVSRLQAIHLSNAMIANGMSFADATVGLNVKVWGPTESFANRRAYYSLIPIVSAYCPAATSFPYTFSRAVGLVLPCSHTHVLSKLTELIKHLLST